MKQELMTEMLVSFNNYYVQWADTSIEDKKDIYNEALELLESWKIESMTNFDCVNAVIEKIYATIKHGFEQHGVDRYFEKKVNKVYGNTELQLHHINLGGIDG